MPYIFRFHTGTNNNIYDWQPSAKITSADVRNVTDKTNVLTSSAGTSIPSPIARMFLFKTAFEIVATQIRDNTLDANSIYSGLVSESLDLLELLYKSGADKKKFRYHRWVFESGSEEPEHFGTKPGHKLLTHSFKQAANQAPFNGRISITLIYYLEGNDEILVGGTSPFTFVFVSPNFRRKMKQKGFKVIRGLTTGDTLFDSNYLQLHERDASFIKYVQGLANTVGIDSSFDGFNEYVTNTARRFEGKFNGTASLLEDINFNDSPLMAGDIHLKQISEQDHKNKISQYSDFKLALPKESSYTGEFSPLFLIHKMALDGQYSSPSNHWSASTEVIEAEYPEHELEKITKNRELPGLSGVRYPFFSSFDFFETALVKMNGYALNDERFVTLTGDQVFAFPIKPIFFHLFHISKIKEYLSVEQKDGEFTFSLKIPIHGPTKGRRTVTCSKVYNQSMIIQYSGILGIFPFTRTTNAALGHINQYTVASYEKTNAENSLESVVFYKDDAIKAITPLPLLRSFYKAINTKTSYYDINGAFDIIRLNFMKNNVSVGGTILPIFKEVINGDASYIYAIDFGTSNTHVEYGLVDDGKIKEAKPFSITENDMQMYLLNKPKEVVLNDSEKYTDYERSMGYVIDSARLVTLREFIPFQIGNQLSATVKFPFRTATCESNTFINSPNNDRLFIDANIGFYIDEDVMAETVRYKTDLKWLLQNSINDPFNINRVALFIRQLMLMIRTKAQLEPEGSDLLKLKMILAFPISMGDTLKNKLTEIFEDERIKVFGNESQPFAQPVTESIAPYYQLKSTNKNIQNDNFCNIDIGGGTTDIVLTKTEEPGNNRSQLLCYCSSFRFAGRQLWSSGVNEYMSSENGFVAYYKNFIAKVDKPTYLELEKVLNSKSVKTEDLVGLLFSKPKYKFKNIFSEQKEFRVIPLIHYAAILYYITRLAEWKNIVLPRTVSFSGKGSEYLNLIFSNTQDLKGFTQKLLSIFSGKQARADFIVEKSAEPKVITAKGALYFAVEEISDEAGDDWGNLTESEKISYDKKLIKDNVVYKGFNAIELENKGMIYADLLNDEALYKDIISNQETFFNFLFDNRELAASINKKLEILDFSKYKEFFIPKNGNIYDSGILRDSFKAVMNNVNLADSITDSPFFFPLNYALIELSVEIGHSSQS